MHRAMIGRKQMDDERRLIRTDPRRLRHPEEVLQARRNPRWSSRLVVDLRLTSISQTNAERSNLVEESGVHLLFKEWHEMPRSVFQIAEALKSQAQFAQRLGDVWWLKSREGQSGEKMFQSRLFYKAVYAHLECLTGEQVGGFSLRCSASRLFNDQLVVKHGAHPFDPLCDEIPDHTRPLLNPVGEEIEQPLRLDSRGHADERQGILLAILHFDGEHEFIGWRFAGHLGRDACR